MATAPAPQEHGFTPGPWEVRRAALPDNTGGYDWAVIAPGKAIIAECFEHVDWREPGVSYLTSPAEAHARLFAAAQDMLAALYQYRDDMRYPPAADSRERRIEMIEALISKAEGRS